MFHRGCARGAPSGDPQGAFAERLLQFKAPGDYSPPGVHLYHQFMGLESQASI